METENETPDPKKWHYDENTGQYFRITAHLPDDLARISTDPYSRRVADWWATRRLARVWRVVIVVAAVIALYGWTFGSWISAIFLSMPLGVFVLFWPAIEINARTHAKRVGPKPKPRPVPAPPAAPHSSTEAETLR